MGERRDRLQIRPPEEALAAARPLPPLEEMQIEGLTDEEWDAFEEALHSC